MVRAREVLPGEPRREGEVRFRIYDPIEPVVRLAIPLHGPVLTYKDYVIDAEPIDKNTFKLPKDSEDLPPPALAITFAACSPRSSSVRGLNLTGE